MTPNRQDLKTFLYSVIRLTDLGSQLLLRQNRTSKKLMLDYMEKKEVLGFGISCGPGFQYISDLAKGELFNKFFKAQISDSKEKLRNKLKS